MAKVTITHHVCGMCGGPYERKHGVRGQRRKWCSDDCRMLASALGTVSTLVDRIRQKATDDAYRELRGTIFRLANVRRGIGRRVTAPVD